ncbi:TetR/AcrR family transcriptional regulator [Methylosinus sp. Ce-a6]|uniref:TetR/AcrR family transcriptional regulator n=1 Tax=Methylosinus sp. Ce-a6 TaxID=2172005 RepID=UPI001358EA85|nr:TetR/AcrR family transcriptional regulator [Methylosinus sp. Ce-a6]
MKRTNGSPRASVGRQRLLETAGRLFLRRGTANVGINEVTEAAGVARMTLYNNFPSKEALTIAVYEQMAETVLQALERLGRPPTEAARIEAIFDFFAASAAIPGRRGCPFIHASLQEAEPAGPIHSLVAGYKRKLRELVLGALDAERGDRCEVADQIVLLLDGAVTEAYIGGVVDPFLAARRAAATLLRSR